MTPSKEPTKEPAQQPAAVIYREPERGNVPGGTLSLGEQVVATIAGLAARDVAGVHAVGKGRLIAFGSNPARGVAAEVGERQAAFDLDIAIEYDCDLRAVAAEVRRRIAAEVDRMAGREVVEININVIDIHLPGEENSKPKPNQPSRVI